MKMSRAVIEWAFDKWCEGYTLKEIASCLGTNASYLSTVFKIYGWKRVSKLPKLEHPFKL